MPMDPRFLDAYVNEVRTQTMYAAQAIESLNFALQELHAAGREHGKREFFHREVFRAIHSFLAHTSNTSRLFWPSVPARRHSEQAHRYAARLSTLDRVQRAEALRDAFALVDDSPLRARTLRDHLEHFDERMDHWRTTSVRQNMVNDMIGPLNAIQGIEPSDMFRCFDPGSKSFIFRGETFDLQSLATEVGRVHTLAQQLCDRSRMSHTAMSDRADG